MTLTPLSAALLAAGGLTDIDATLFYLTIALFGLFALILGKFAWGPLLGLIEEREAKIREAIEGSEKANAEAKALLQQHQQMLREAGREREEIVKKTRQEAEQLKADLTAKARAESDLIVQRAKEQIEREKALAIREIRTQVVGIAMKAASKIVTSSLTPEAQKKLVDDYVATLPEVPQ